MTSWCYRAMENPSESGGSFDASGAFHGGTVYSDDEEVLIKIQMLLRTLLLSNLCNYGPQRYFINTGNL